MVTLRALRPDDATALTRVYSGASIRHTTGRPLTLGQAHEKIRAALARAAEAPRAQWSWGILRADTWGHGYATQAVHQVVSVAFTTAGLNRLEAMHHPDNPASGRVLAKAGFTRIGTSDRQTDNGTVPYELYALEPPDRCPRACLRWRSTHPRS
ncbi:GNAT family N-acetyltransferase [Streptomyces sp. NBC_00209]|uniref:GNAT family N-acetyltransferase n=1 Tax=Streptomyces sp. NBC_00209 TaxID=2975682 RepID=UPI0032483FEF